MEEEQFGLDDELINEKVPHVGKKELNEGIDEMTSGSSQVEVSTNQDSRSILPFVYNNTDSLDLFELGLRGYFIDRKQGELIYVKKPLANKKGINDIMGEVRLLTSKQNSFAIRKKYEIMINLEILEQDWSERYIYDKTCDEFEIKPEDGYKIVNDMYNLVFSAWSQGLEGASLRFLRDSTKISESNSQPSQQKKGIISGLFRR